MAGAAWVQAVATVILVGVTVFYAVQTKGLLDEARRTQRREVEERRRERSEQAALEVLRYLQLRHMQPAMGPIDTEAAALIVLALNSQALLIDNDELQQRILACSSAARFLQWSDDLIASEKTNRAAASFRLQRLAVDIGSSVLAYLRGEELPHWDDDLPRPPTAFAWIVRPVDAP